MSTTTTILLVEDDPDHALLARRSLAAQDQDVRGTAGSNGKGGAGDGRSPEPPTLVVAETLTAARAWLAVNAPDLVISDLHLPDGSGLELASASLPVVVMTSQGDEEKAVQAMKGGALDYVVKSPQMYRDLPRIVERALRAARADRDRARAEASLRESEERFRQLADNIQDAFWLYDVNLRRMVYASPAWTRVYGEAEQPGAAVHPVHRPACLHADDRAAVIEALAERAPTVALTHEYRLVEGKKTRWIAERTFPVPDANGRPWRIAGLGSDATRRRELEATLRQSQKMEAVGQLAGGVAHDLNNMLTAILAAADQFSHSTGTPEQRELCHVVVTAAERSAELTRRLLAFSRKGNVRSAPVDVHGVVRETVRLLERSIDKRVVIKAELKADRAVVVGDASQLQGALLNLGLNARDAMPDGGDLTITTAMRVLDQSACATLPFDIKPGRYLDLGVRDNGIGISPENLTRVFEPFFTTKPVGQGTGLGLAAVYGTAIEHGGAVTVYSELRQGTVFHLYLPLYKEDAPAAEPPVIAQAGTGLVLIVDDEPLIRKVGAQLLEGLGYEVVTAQDGAEGVRKFSEHHDRLVAVMCDLVMPIMSGADATRRMRELDPKVPIIVCSGYPRDERAGSATLGRNYDGYLPKPFRRGDIAEILAQLARRL